jgi:spore coat protein U-like protein
MKIKNLLLAASLSFIGTAYAATVSAPMQVTSTVTPVCSISIDPMNFGTFNLTSTNVKATSNIRATCTKGTSYTLKMDGGTSGDPTNRYMIRAGGTEKLQYNLYSMATLIPFNTVFIGGTGTGLTDTFPFDGALVGGVNLNAPVGSYADTVTVTIDY